MGNVSFEYDKVCELEILKHARCGLEGESKFQGSDIRRIVLEDTPDDLESGRIATLSNHFDRVNCGCGVVFTLHQAMAASSVLNRFDLCYPLFIDAKLELRVAHRLFTYPFDFESVNVFGIWVPLTQAHRVRSVR